ncbi:MAG: hypothetical protein LBT44_02945 [Clostridiales bacterium]|jgi:hypothetical protein|nr:hypothetical protein [Clostridiales bacterium]
MKITKRILAALLAVTALLSVLVLSASATSFSGQSTPYGSMSGGTSGGNATVGGVASKYVYIYVNCSGTAPVLRTDVEIQDYITGNSITSPVTLSHQVTNTTTNPFTYYLVGRTAKITAWGAHYVKPASGTGTIRYTQLIGA